MKLLYLKSDICRLLDTSHGQLAEMLPEDIKKQIDWEPGRQKFKDSEVFTVVKYFRSLKTDAEIREMIYSI